MRTNHRLKRENGPNSPTWPVFASWASGLLAIAAGILAGRPSAISQPTIILSSGEYIVRSHNGFLCLQSGISDGDLGSLDPIWNRNAGQRPVSLE